MLKYAKIINKDTKEVQVGLGIREEYYKSHGFTLMEVELCTWNNCWYLKGWCPEEPEVLVKQKRITQIKTELNIKDEKSTRSIRAILAGTATEADKQFLNHVEAEVSALRKELKELEG